MPTRSQRQDDAVNSLNHACFNSCARCARGWASDEASSRFVESLIGRGRMGVSMAHGGSCNQIAFIVLHRCAEQVAMAEDVVTSWRRHRGRAARNLRKTLGTVTTKWHFARASEPCGWARICLGVALIVPWSWRRARLGASDESAPPFAMTRLCLVATLAPVARPDRVGASSVTNDQGTLQEQDISLTDYSSQYPAI